MTTFTTDVAVIIIDELPNDPNNSDRALARVTLLDRRMRPGDFDDLLALNITFDEELPHLTCRVDDIEHCRLGNLDPATIHAESGGIVGRSLDHYPFQLAALNRMC